MKKMEGEGRREKPAKAKYLKHNDHCVRGKVQPVLLAWCTKMYNATLCRWFELLLA